MENFTLYNPVKLHFGRGVLGKLKDAAAGLGKRALLVYGKGSVHTNGSYQQTLEGLQAAGIQVFEYAGIKSNPIIEDVDAAAEIGRKHKVDMIVAVGGGSVIDSAKIMAITIPVEHSGWEFVDGKKKPQSALPLIAVLTLAATGTEMNAGAVVQNDKARKKTGYSHKLLFPRHSFLDPTFTISVPASYTSYGITDLVAHTLESWFGEGDASLSDRFVLAILKETMKYGPELMKNPDSYDLRARIMYAATAALNGLTNAGRKTGDWGVHHIGHCLSVKYDIAHGASLSIVYPAWLSLQKDRIPDRITELGKSLFSVDNVEDTIYKLEYFFKLIDSPVRLSQMDIRPTEEEQADLIEIMKTNKVDGLVHKLSQDDYRFLIREML
jgi:alcohol dehydrogenase YqhD (iron-dependent ADH family)